MRRGEAGEGERERERETRCICICCTMYCVLVVLRVLMFLFETPDCWLKVGIWKVLRPATQTQVLLGFLVSLSEC